MFLNMRDLRQSEQPSAQPVKPYFITSDSEASMYHPKWASLPDTPIHINTTIEYTPGNRLEYDVPASMLIKRVLAESKPPVEIYSSVKGFNNAFTRAPYRGTVEIGTKKFRYFIADYTPSKIEQLTMQSRRQSPGSEQTAAFNQLVKYGKQKNILVMQGFVSRASVGMPGCMAVPSPYVGMSNAMQFLTSYGGISASAKTLAFISDDPDYAVRQTLTEKAFDCFIPENIAIEFNRYYNIIHESDPISIVMSESGSTKEEATQILESRINLYNQFPIDKCKYSFGQFFRERSLDDNVNAFASPESASIIRSFAGRMPNIENAVIVVDYDGLSACIDEMKAAGMSVSDIQGILMEIREKIYDEFLCFNFPFFVYLSNGGMPSSIVNLCVDYYNKRQKEKAEKNQKTAIIKTVMLLPALLIPGAGLAVFSGLQTTIGLLDAYSNAKKQQAAIKRDVAGEEMKTDILIEAEKEYIVTHPNQLDPEAEENKKKVGKYMLAGGGVIAALISFVSFK